MSLTKLGDRENPKPQFLYKLHTHQNWQENSPDVTGRKKSPTKFMPRSKGSCPEWKLQGANLRRKNEHEWGGGVGRGLGASLLVTATGCKINEDRELVVGVPTPTSYTEGPCIKETVLPMSSETGTITPYPYNSPHRRYPSAITWSKKIQTF